LMGVLRDWQRGLGDRPDYDVLSWKRVTHGWPKAGLQLLKCKCLHNQFLK
jgi:hypothetical protein